MGYRSREKSELETSTAIVSAETWDTSCGSSADARQGNLQTGNGKSRFGLSMATSRRYIPEHRRSRKPYDFWGPRGSPQTKQHQQVVEVEGICVTACEIVATQGKRGARVWIIDGTKFLYEGTWGWEPSWRINPSSPNGGFKSQAKENR